jgi:WD40 repeat protein
MHLIVLSDNQEVLSPPNIDKGTVTYPARVFRVADGRELSRFYTNRQLTRLAPRIVCSECSKELLAVAEEKSPIIRLFEIADGSLRGELSGNRDGIHGLAFTPDGKTLVSGGEDGVTILWNVTLRSAGKQ